MTVNVSKPALNVREKLAELDKPTGIAGEAMLRAETPQEQFNLIGAGRRNLIINGDFQVSQRGDYSSATATSDAIFHLDRWKTSVSGINANVQRITSNLPDEASYAIRMEATSTAASAYLGIRQNYEHMDRIVGIPLRVSAWVRTNNPNCRLTFYDGVGAQVSEPHSGNGSWEKLEMNVTSKGSAYALFDVFISSYNVGYTSVTSGDYFEVTLYQVERGKVATPFEHRSYGEELALCQRYFEQMSGGAGEMIAGVGQAFDAYSGETAIIYKVEKRAAPTITTSGAFQVWLGQGSANITSNAFSEVRTNQATWQYGGGSGASVGQAIQFYANSVSATVKIDAEL